MLADEDDWLRLVVESVEGDEGVGLGRGRKAPNIFLDDDDWVVVVEEDEVLEIVDLLVLVVDEDPVFEDGEGAFAGEDILER